MGRRNTYNIAAVLIYLILTLEESDARTRYYYPSHDLISGTEADLQQHQQQQQQQETDRTVPVIVNPSSKANQLDQMKDDDIKEFNVKEEEAESQEAPTSKPITTGSKLQNLQEITNYAGRPTVVDYSEKTGRKFEDEEEHRNEINEDRSRARLEAEKLAEEIQSLIASSQNMFTNIVKKNPSHPPFYFTQRRKAIHCRYPSKRKCPLPTLLISGISYKVSKVDSSGNPEPLSSQPW